jgi:putative endopeptidase
MFSNNILIDKPKIPSLYRQKSFNKLMKLTKIAIWTWASIALVACQTHNNADTRTSFFDLTGMDSTANPADDFATYANGKWLKNTKIPDDQSGWGSIYVLSEDNLTKTKHILEEVAKTGGSKGSVEQMVGDLYASGMDTLTIEKLGIEPIKGTLAQIESIKTVAQYLDFVSKNPSNRGGALFGFGIYPDDKNSTKNMVNFGQAGLGLPEKDYYVKTDPETQKVRNAYLTYLTKLLSLSGVDSTTAQKQAKEVLAFETILAKSHKSPVELRDPVKNYHKFAVSALSKVAPMDWKTFLSNLQLKVDTVLVSQPAYYTALYQTLNTTPIEVVKLREKVALLDQASPYLNKAFRDARFDFYGKVLNGQQVQSERWKKVADQVDSGLGDLLGQLWVKKYFKPEAKERMLTLVNNLQKVYRQRIEKLDWMSAETKQKALVKMDKIINKIGYPEKWKSYKGVSIDPAKYYDNMMQIAAFGYQENLDKLAKPVDKTEWGMTPPTVNAYANPSFNEIVFPAGILQFPFFDNAADDAINYGGIGAVIGHEMTHLFDDQGRQYDADGNLKDWWKEEDAKKFMAKAQIVVGQYNSFTVLDNLHVNGELTLGENLADIGGITLAYEAFLLTDQAKSTEKIDGFTPAQRFFLSWAQVWRMKNRDETMRVRISTDPHSPEQYRINGPLMNFEPFYEAFNVKSTNKMYLAPEKRAIIW